MINLLELRATYTTGGGPDKTILLSAEKHDKETINPIVIYLRDKKDKNFKIGDMAKGRGFEYIEVLDRHKIDIKCVNELNRIVRDKQIDIIHGHDYKTDMLAWILKRRNPHVKIVSTAHGWITNNVKGKWIKSLHLRFLTRFDLNIAVSNATREILLKKRIPPGRIQVIHNAIDTHYWKRLSTASHFREEVGVPQDAFVIGTVGRIGAEKDYKTWLKVARQVKARYPRTHFVIVGDGKFTELMDLKTYAASLSLNNSVTLCGYRDDVLNIYSSFDLFLLTSLTEGLPNTILEAMAMSVPVVSTDVGGVRELIVDGRTGFLSKVREISKLVDIISNLITNASLRRTITVNARRFIEDRFSFEKRIKRIELIYEEMVHNTPQESKGAIS